MARNDRSIKIAFDEVTGEVLDADEFFGSKKEGFQIRKEFNRDEVELFCCECQQKLDISNSKYDRLHFKHHVNADYCILKDGNLTPEQLESISRHLKAKESDRHKELKNRIGQRIASIQDIEPNSVAIDNKFIIRGKEKRRPDVLCRYKGKEIAFEIQLSDLSLRYILSRYDFYKQHGIYLIWILDDFDIHGQSQMERDIKYLTKYHNFFKLDETVNNFKLHCRFKFPFLTENNKLLIKWLEKSVTFDEIKFDEAEYQIYYYDFDSKKRQREQEQQKWDIEIREAERTKQQEEETNIARFKAKGIINEIKRLRAENSQDYSSAERMIRGLDDFQIDIFNSELRLNRDSSRKPALLQWISEARPVHVAFIAFILRNESIYIDVNKKDSSGTTAFQELLANKNITKYTITRGLLRRGYKMTPEDLDLLPEDSLESKNDKFIYQACSNLNNRWLVDQVFQHSKLIFIIESAKRGKIIGFKFNEDQWLAFANSAIHNHKEYWEYIELAFKHYGFWNKLISIDKNGTFKRKIQEFYSNMPDQKYDFDPLFKALYQEVE